MEKTLRRWARVLVESTGTSPIATDARGIQVINDFFRREGMDWTSNLGVTPLRVGVNSAVTDGVDAYSAADRGHLDLYLTVPDRLYPWGENEWRNLGGRYPSQWNAIEEDLTTGHPVGEILHGNSLSLDGPIPGAEVDTLGTGRTRNRSKFQTYLHHEMQHAMPPIQHYGGNRSEFWSAAAEVVGGHHDTAPSSEFPYDFPMLDEYQCRTAFMGYLAYNFRNADTARTLVGMRDDLLFKWAKGRTASAVEGLTGMSQYLSDSECATCAAKQYFRPGGTALPVQDRVGVLLHNWRVALFANHPTLDEGQYGHPAWSGFDPRVNLGVWKSFAGTFADDVDALPQVVTLTSSNLDAPVEFRYSRSLHGGTRPLAISQLGSNYWVIRAGSGLTSQDRRLVVRFTPRSSLGSSLNAGTMRGGRLHISAIRYDHADTSAAEESILMHHPEWITSVTPLVTAEMDSVPGELEVELPQFGATTRAVVLVMSLAEGRHQLWSDQAGGFVRAALRYRMALELRDSTEPFLATPLVADAVARIHPVFAPDGHTVVYAKATVGATEFRLHRRSVTGGSEQQLNQQTLPQYYPEVSPRGDVVAYEGWTSPGQTNLYLTPLTPSGSSSPQALTTLDGCEFLPAFQPNGRGIAYIHASPGAIALRWIGVDGTGDRLVATLTGLNGAVQRPRWSIDGSRIHLPLLETGNRIAWVPSAGGSWTVLPDHDLPVRSFDFHPGNGPRLIETDIPLPVTTSGSDYTVPRIALYTPETGTRDTSFRYNREFSVNTSPRYSHSGTRVVQEARRTGGVFQVHWARVTDNQPPVFSTIEDQFGVACVPLQFQLPATDPEGGALTWQAYYKPPGSQLVQGNVFRWNHPDVGEYWVLFRVTDPRGDVDTRVVQITITDDGSCEELLTGGEGGGGGGYSMRTAESSTRLPGAVTAGLGTGGSFMDGAAMDSWESRLASLPHSGAVVDGSYLVSLDARSAAGVDLDRLRLVAVDHDPATLALAAGTGVVVGRPESVSIRSVEGTPVVVSSTEPVLLAPGDEVEVAVPEDPTVGLAVHCRRADAATASGLELRVAQAGGWVPAGVLRPRRDADRLAFAPAPTGPVRLRALAPTLLLGVEVLHPGSPGAPPMPTEIGAVALSGEASAAALETAEGGAVRIEPGAPRLARFPAPAAAEGLRRTLLLSMQARVPRQESARASDPAEPASPTVGVFALAAVQPNPASQRATLAFSLAEEDAVTLDIHDLQGARVRRVTGGRLAAGHHWAHWDGRDDSGQPARTGTYFVRLASGGQVATRRFVLVR
jgi:Tol biopolymer transport system component